MSDHSNALASTQELLYHKEDGIATITLNRPEKLNAFTPAMIDAWYEALRDAAADDEVRVVVVTGAGRAFCSGRDVRAMGEHRERWTPIDHKNHLWQHIHRIPKFLETFDKPYIAALNGLAVGAGLDMALMADLRFAADDARFSEGYVKVGLVPGDGGSYFLPRVVGYSRALELLWTGRWVSAEEALAMGLVNRVVPRERLLEETYAFARELAAGPQIAIRMIKRAVRQSMRCDLETALDLISSHMALVRQTEDHREGIAAFREKRPPRFVGR